MASDFDGAFAQYVKVPAGEVFPVDCDWSDAELATIPCAYGTAENMLHRAALGADEHLLVTGASGGVGSATVQLARRRGARITAMCGASKMDRVRALGAQRIVGRDEDIAAALADDPVDLVVDNVAGPGFPQMLKVLRRGGRYVSSGAIAGPLVNLDMRDMYLKDIALIGCTAWDEPVFPDLVGYIERGEIRPPPRQDLPAGRDRPGPNRVHGKGPLRQLRPPAAPGLRRNRHSATQARPRAVTSEMRRFSSALISCCFCQASFESLGRKGGRRLAGAERDLDHVVDPMAVEGGVQSHAAAPLVDLLRQLPSVTTDSPAIEHCPAPLAVLSGDGVMIPALSGGYKAGAFEGKSSASVAGCADLTPGPAYVSQSP